MAALLRRFLRNFDALRQERANPSMGSPLTMNATALLDPSVSQSVHELRPIVEGVVKSQRNLYAKMACVNYLFWCAALDRAEALATKYPDLFEPLIEMLELGGGFALDEGYVVLTPRT